MIYYKVMQMIDKKHINAVKLKDGHVTACPVCSGQLWIHKSRLSEKVIFECASSCWEEDILKAFQD